MSVFRSFLFSPANHARRVEKALSLETDAVILDLEDAVANAEKVGARQMAVDALRRHHAPLGYIRVNALCTEWSFGDFYAVIQEGVDGIVLPKVETPADLCTAHWLMSQLERERGLPDGAIDLMPIIETGAGVLGIEAIARTAAQIGRTKRVAFGAGDFTLDMNLTWSTEETELLPYRSAVVLASRAAGLEQPIDTVWVRIKDTEGFERSTRRAQALGFQGKLCIYPDQPPVVNAIFSPKPEEVQRAKAIVEAFAAAEAAGSASIQLDGEFIDYPIVYRAQRILDMARRIGRGT
jgi:citrate lyase subunit beta/citryl-CoA lyase